MTAAETNVTEGTIRGQGLGGGSGTPYSILDTPRPRQHVVNSCDRPMFHAAQLCLLQPLTTLSPGERTTLHACWRGSLQCFVRHTGLSVAKVCLLQNCET